MLRLGRFDKFQTTIVVVLAAAAIGYGLWSSLSAARLDSARALPATLRDSGWRMALDAQSVQGFPARADLTLAAVSLEPDAKTPSWPFRLAIPDLLTRSLLYRPDFLGLSAPTGFTIETPTGDLEINGGVAASLAFGGTTGPDGRPLERVSVSGPLLRFATVAEGSGAARREGTAELAELHLRSAPDGDPASRRLFLRLDGVALEDRPAAEIAHVRLDGLLSFAAPPSTGAGLALEARRLELGDAAKPGLSIMFPDGEITLSGVLDRSAGAWRGLLGFATDQGPAVLARLLALDLLTEDEAAVIGARIAESGRLAGVVRLQDGQLTVEDIQPDAIPIAMPARPSMETFWRLR